MGVWGYGGLVFDVAVAEAGDHERKGEQIQGEPGESMGWMIAQDDGEQLGWVSSQAHPIGSAAQEAMTGASSVQLVHSCTNTSTTG